LQPNLSVFEGLSFAKTQNSFHKLGKCRNLKIRGSAEANIKIECAKISERTKNDETYFRLKMVE